MTIFEPISIPREYWLDVDKFDYNLFNYDDIRCIYNSPITLIEDFEKVKGFKNYVRYIIQQYKKKRKRNIVATTSTTPPTARIITNTTTNTTTNSINTTTNTTTNSTNTTTNSTNTTTNSINTATNIETHKTFGKTVKDILFNLSLLKK